jgi:hypothetical protein
MAGEMVSLRLVAEAVRPEGNADCDERWARQGVASPMIGLALWSELVAAFGSEQSSLRDGGLPETALRE